MIRTIVCIIAAAGFLSVGVQQDREFAIKPGSDLPTLTQNGAAVAVCVPGEIVVFNTDTDMIFDRADVTQFHHECWLRTSPSILNMVVEDRAGQYMNCNTDSFTVSMNSQFIPPEQTWKGYVACRGNR